MALNIHSGFQKKNESTLDKLSASKDACLMNMCEGVSELRWCLKEKAEHRCVRFKVLFWNGKDSKSNKRYCEGTVNISTA